MTCVAVTACGNFGLGGTENGKIKMWNMQSGLERKLFDVGERGEKVEVVGQIGQANGGLKGKGKGKGKGKELDLRVRRAISGVETDSLNRIVVASTLDGYLYVSHVHSSPSEGNRFLNIRLFSSSTSTLPPCFTP